MKKSTKGFLLGLGAAAAAFGAYYVYHTVCPTCGYYRGMVAIVKEAAE